MRIHCHLFEQRCEKEIKLLYYLGKILQILSGHFGAHIWCVLGSPLYPDPWNYSRSLWDFQLLHKPIITSAISRPAFPKVFLAKDTLWKISSIPQSACSCSHTCHHLSFALPAVLLVLAGFSPSKAHQAGRTLHQHRSQLCPGSPAHWSQEHHATTPKLLLQGQDSFTRYTPHLTIWKVVL